MKHAHYILRSTQTAERHAETQLPLGKKSLLPVFRGLDNYSDPCILDEKFSVSTPTPKP